MGGVSPNVRPDIVTARSSKRLLSSALIAGILAISPALSDEMWRVDRAIAAEKAQSADDQDANSSDDQQSDDAGKGNEVEPINPGEAMVTRFSHTIEDADEKGKPTQVIDTNGVSASIIDLRNPGEPAYGQHWFNEPQRMSVRQSPEVQMPRRIHQPCLRTALCRSDCGSPG